MKIGSVFWVMIGVFLAACGPQQVTTPLGISPQEALAPHVENVCLTVVQIFTQERSSQELNGAPSQPIAEGVERILDGKGTNVVAEGEPCDATLTIRVDCRPDGVSYQHTGGPGQSYCFTGAICSVRGVMVIPGQEEIDFYTSGRHDTPIETHSCPSETQAPFGEAWSIALLDGLAYLWGPEILDYADPADLVPTPELWPGVIPSPLP
jgi:hypothetical protein